MLTAFYQTAAQLCFTLLGLWWLVLQTKYAAWIADGAQRRLATTVSLYFLLPGAMSLIALLGSDIPLVWRASFAIASALGVVATAPVGLAGRVVASARWSALARWLGVVLYLVILLVALEPTLAAFVHATPLLVAGIGLSLLVTLGAVLAWAYFLEPVSA